MALFLFRRSNISFLLASCAPYSLASNHGSQRAPQAANHKPLATQPRLPFLSWSTKSPKKKHFDARPASTRWLTVPPGTSTSDADRKRKWPALGSDAGKASHNHQSRPSDLVSPATLVVQQRCARTANYAPRQQQNPKATCLICYCGASLTISGRSRAADESCSV